MINKEALAKAVLGDNVFDYGIPLDFQTKASELGIDTDYIVWSYPKDSMFGKPVDVRDGYETIITKALDIIYETYKACNDNDLYKAKYTLNELYGMLNTGKDVK